MINIIAPINQLGYGITGLNLSKALHQVSDVSLWPISTPQVTNQLDSDLVSRMLNNSLRPDFSAPCIRIWHQHDMSQFVGHGLKIGFPIFELDKFTDIEKHHLGHLDKIFVCSHWAKDVVLKETSTKFAYEENVHVIPLGVDSTIFQVQSRDAAKTVFFNCGKWEVRKGHDVLVDAFNKAFNDDDDVELWMLCDNPFYSPDEQKEWEQLYSTSKLGSKIRIINRLDTQKEVYNIMANTDCGVFPSRAEGWNLELLEMMSCGKHVIATDYSAHTEFCTKENSLLVTIEEKETAYDGKWFTGKSGEWAKLGDNQVEQVVVHMREVHKRKQSASLGVNEGGVATAQEFSWNNSASKVLESIHEYI